MTGRKQVRITPDGLRAMAMDFLASFEPDEHGLNDLGAILHRVATAARKQALEEALMVARKTIDDARAGVIDTDLRSVKSVMAERFADLPLEPDAKKEGA